MLARRQHYVRTRERTMSNNCVSWASRAVLLMTVLCSMLPATGQDAGEPGEDWLHSDLPLFGPEKDEVWPRSFIDDESFGCTSRVAFGDWAFRKTGEAAEDATWYRFSNYGAMHCWANVSRAWERARLEGADVHSSFFVLIGDATVSGKRIELWLVQTGARPGSDYLLLSREPADALIDRFDVLQVVCPRANVRDRGSLGIIITRYCAINSRREMLKFAHRMAQLPPLGTLTLQADDDSHDAADRARSASCLLSKVSAGDRMQQRLFGPMS
jgi:hypothetical protein